MSELKVDPTYGVEAWINENGEVLVRQFDPGLDQNITLVLSGREALTLASWIQQTVEDESR